VRRCGFPARRSSSSRSSPCPAGRTACASSRPPGSGRAGCSASPTGTPCCRCTTWCSAVCSEESRAPPRLERFGWLRQLEHDMNDDGRRSPFRHPAWRDDVSIEGEAGRATMTPITVPLRRVLMALCRLHGRRPPAARARPRRAPPQRARGRLPRGGRVEHGVDRAGPRLRRGALPVRSVAWPLAVIGALLGASLVLSLVIAPRGAAAPPVVPLSVQRSHGHDDA